MEDLNKDISEKEKTQERLMARGEYIKHLYLYLLTKKPVELAIFSSLTFLLPVIPYIWVAAKFHLNHESDEHMRSYYGDGSMITLCAGILCSYFAILFDFRNHEQKLTNVLINIALLFAFIFCLFIFEHCQLNFARDWCFIKQIVFLSGGLLLITFCTSIYLNFDSKISYDEVLMFKDNLESKRIAQKAKNTTQTDDGVNL